MFYKEWGEVSPLLFALSFNNIKFKHKTISRNDPFGAAKKYGTLPVIRRKDRTYMSDVIAIARYIGKSTKTNPTNPLECYH